MKNFKKQFGIIATLICLCFCVCFMLPLNFISADTSPASSISDIDMSQTTITVSNSDNGTTFLNEEGVTTDYSSFNEGFESIILGLSSATNLNFIFSNYISNETINLYASSNVFEITISGEITSQTNIFDISGDLNLNILAKNLSLITNTTNTYAFNINNPNSLICLEGNINSNLTNFANGGVGLFTIANALNVTNKLKIVMPCILNAKLFESPDNLDNIDDLFEIVPEADFFEIVSSVVNGNYVISSILKVNFTTNGGTFDNAYNIPQLLNNGEVFATAEQINKEHFNFNGWVGIIEFSDDDVLTYQLSSNTYYFNEAMAQNFLNSGMTYNDINNYFATSTEDFNLDNSILGYNQNDSHAQVFIALKKTPNYSAIWTDKIYTIDFVTNGGNNLSSISNKFNETIALPVPTKVGCKFEGWYIDQKLSTPLGNIEKMPGENIILYAKWSDITYTITFKNNNEITTTLNLKYGETITYPNLDSITGMEFAGWFTEDDVLFNNETMPDNSFTLIAKWTIKKYSIYINSMGGQTYSAITLEYGSVVPEPTIPSKPGAIFDGWYADSNYQTPFSFKNLTMPAKNQTVFAKWKSILYYVNFVTNTSQTLPSLNLVYGESIMLPTPQSVKGKKFEAWYLDKELTKKFDLTVMPNNNLTLYAKYIDKLTLSIDTSSQTYEVTNNDSSFSRFSELDGFRVMYKVDGEWTFSAPTKVGTYDVKIERSEDGIYAAFETVIENGFVIVGEKINLSWLIIVLFIFTGLEFIACVIIRALRQMKRKMTLMAFTPIFGFMLPTDQFVLLIISGVLALFMFVLTIYEVVKLHNTLPEAAIKKQRQSNVSENNEIEVYESTSNEENNYNEFKQEEAFGSKYSAQDIQNLLYQDNYRSQHSANISNGTKPVEKTYESAIDIAKQNSINRKFSEDDNDDSVIIQDKNGRFEKHSQNISKIKTYDQEFDDWRSKIQTDIPEN